MKTFIDTTNIHEIRETMSLGMLDEVTINAERKKIKGNNG
jgi:hypothetical protein